MRKIFPIFAVILGAYWVYASFGYGLWIRRGPGGGFFPLIGGTITAFFGLIYLAGEIRNPKPGHFSWKFSYPILAVLGVLLASYAGGLLPAILLFIVLWLRLYEKKSMLLSACVALGTAGVLYAVFVCWLSVPIPRGILGDMIFG